MQECEAYVELISGRLDGTLTPEEQAALDAHLAQCPDCRSLMQDLQAISGDLSELAPVPEGFADRVMQAVAQQEQSAPELQVVPKKQSGKRWRKPLLRIGALAACCVLVVGMSRFVLGFMRCGSADPSAGNNETAAADQEVSGESASPINGTEPALRYEDSIYRRQDEVLAELPDSAVGVGAVIPSDTNPPELAGCLLYEDSAQPDVIYVENPDGSYSCWTKEA